MIALLNQLTTPELIILGLGVIGLNTFVLWWASSRLTADPREDRDANSADRDAEILGEEPARSTVASPRARRLQPAGAGRPAEASLEAMEPAAPGGGKAFGGLAGGATRPGDPRDLKVYTPSGVGLPAAAAPLAGTGKPNLGKDIPLTAGPASESPGKGKPPEKEPVTAGKPIGAAAPPAGNGPKPPQTPAKADLISVDKPAASLPSVLPAQSGSGAAPAGIVPPAGKPRPEESADVKKPLSSIKATGASEPAAPAGLIAIPSSTPPASGPVGGMSKPPVTTEPAAEKKVPAPNTPAETKSVVPPESSKTAGSLPGGAATGVPEVPQKAFWRPRIFLPTKLPETKPAEESNDKAASPAAGPGAGAPFADAGKSPVIPPLAVPAAKAPPAPVPPAKPSEVPAAPVVLNAPVAAVPAVAPVVAPATKAPVPASAPAGAMTSSPSVAPPAPASSAIPAAAPTVGITAPKPVTPAASVTPPPPAASAAAKVEPPAPAKPAASTPAAAAPVLPVIPVSAAKPNEPAAKPTEPAVKPSEPAGKSTEPTPAPVVAASAPTPAPAAVASVPPVPAKPPQLSMSNETTSPAKTSAQLTLGFEITSLQLTPFFKLGSVQLRPLSDVVSLHLITSQQADGPMAAGISFQIEKVEVTEQSQVRSILLKPLGVAQPATIPQPKLQVDAIQLSQAGEGSPIQITPSQQTSTAVQFLATFNIASMEFTPAFEIGSLRLEPTSNSVSLRLAPSQRGATLDLPPTFEMSNVKIGPEAQLTGVTLTPTATPASGEAAPK